MNSREDKPRQSTADLISYGREIVLAMKANGYRGVVWDDVLDRLEELARSSGAARESALPECAPANPYAGKNPRCKDGCQPETRCDFDECPRRAATSTHANQQRDNSERRT